MTWLRRYQLRHYFANSVWILPVLGAAAAIGAVRVLDLIEPGPGSAPPVDAAAALALLGTMASAMFTAVVFVCSALLVAVQLASAQLTPRVIAVVFRDPVTKFSLTLLVFTFTLALATLVRIKSSVPLISGYLAAYGSLLSLAVFFYLIDHLGKALRPSGVLRVVAFYGRQVIEGVYPRRLAGPQASAPPELPGVPGREPAATVRSCKDGVVLAFDREGLVRLAAASDAVIEMVPQVGDFVAAGDPLFRVYSGGATPAASALCQSIAVGQERTLEQDPAFAFRIMVDIASKALSPAINDPTTAVLALDQIHHLLRTVGERDLSTGRVADAAGRLRLVYRTPDWEDFVYLAVTEIRLFGGESIQVARRLHALLENLIATLPESRGTLLRRELALLHRSAQRAFSEAEDRALAEVSDYQGVGGNMERSTGTTGPGAGPTSTSPAG
jgi:uncharacterized membrane protein